MKLKILLSILIGVLSFPAFSEMEDSSFNYGEGSKTVSQSKYIGGGIASIFLGWGIGHAIQGRYKDRGWIFTAGGALITIGVIGVSSDCLLYCIASHNKGALTTIEVIGVSSSLIKKSTLENADSAEVPAFSGVDYAFFGAILVGSVIRIWEMIDAWMLPSHYKIVKESPFQISPLAFYDPQNRFYYGLSLNYKF